MSKKPKAQFAPNVARQPHSPEARNHNAERPSWRIARMEFVDPFGWHAVSSARLRYIQERLGQFEAMTWNEILIHGRKQNHSIPVSRLCKIAQDRLALLLCGNTDIDELVSLRFTGKERVWGIRDQAVMSLLWWDPDHAVCPSLLKNT